MSETSPLLKDSKIGENETSSSNGNYGINSESNVIDVTALTRGDTSPPPKDKSYERRRWISLYVIYFTMFLSAVTFSIVVSSIYPYLQKITRNGASTTFLGYVIAVYSLGQLVASPLMGLWSDYQHAMIPIQAGLAIIVIFNVVYSYAVAFPGSTGKYIVLVSRLLIGTGGGTAAVCRSYASAASHEYERPSVFGAISAAQAIGFIVGPVLGLIFVPLGGQGWKVSFLKFHFDMYTGPAYLSTFLAIINMILMVVFFREYRLAPRKDKLRKMKTMNANFDPVMSDTLTTTGTSLINTSKEFEIKKTIPYDCISALICIFIFTIILFGFSVYETIITPYSMDEFAWSNKQGVLYNNILFGAVSIISASNFIGIRYVVRCIDERTGLMAALILMAIGFFVIIPMGNDYPKIGISVINPPIGANMTENPHTMSLIGNATYPVGCRMSKLSWCTEVPQMYMFQYIIGVIFFVLGYPASFVLCFTIYSKVLGRRSQGVMMGIITAFGSFGRCLGPLLVTLLYDILGPQITFAVVIGTIGLAIITLALGYYRIVPNGQKRGFSKKI